jgi:hypothetical protein
MTRTKVPKNTSKGRVTVGHLLSSHRLGSLSGIQCYARRRHTRHGALNTRGASPTRSKSIAKESMARMQSVLCGVISVHLLASLLIAQTTKPASKPAGNPPPVIWRDPGDIAARNLYYGPGGKEHAPLPRAKYFFVKDDPGGTNPKFDVRDERGVEWKVKLGTEVKQETAATRLLWGVGYFANEDYYVPEIRVEGMPALKRGQEFVSAGGIVHQARLERELDTEKAADHWSWFENPFVGTKEFDGLKIVMALINNWDLKDLNNRIYEQSGGEQRYVVSDLGETFGDPGGQMRGDLRGYGRVEFIDQVTAQDVSFFVPNRPQWPFLIVEFWTYQKHRTMEKIFQRIPREHARWIGQRLGQLSPEQIRDCFRAGGYSPKEVDGFAKVVLERIARLKQL